MPSFLCQYDDVVKIQIFIEEAYLYIVDMSI